MIVFFQESTSRIERPVRHEWYLDYCCKSMTPSKRHSNQAPGCFTVLVGITVISTMRRINERFERNAAPRDGRSTGSDHVEHSMSHALSNGATARRTGSSTPSIGEKSHHAELTPLTTHWRSDGALLEEKRR